MPSRSVPSRLVAVPPAQSRRSPKISSLVSCRSRVRAVVFVIDKIGSAAASLSCGADLVPASLLYSGTMARSGRAAVPRTDALSVPLRLG